MAQVQQVLEEIGAADVSQVLVFNKVDALADQERPVVWQDAYALQGRTLDRVFVSARTGEGLAALRELLSQKATRHAVELEGCMDTEQPDDSSIH